MILGKKMKGTIALLAFLVGLYAFAIAFILPSANFSPILQKLALTPAPSLIHFIGGGIAIILGIFQFNSTLRKRYFTMHQNFGTVYFFAVFSSGIASLYMGPLAHGGVVAQVGFTTLSLLWLASAFLSLKAILKGDVQKHKFWIYLNYSLTLAALTLRLQMPFGVPLFGFETFYPIVAWSCWVPNIIIAYLIVTHKKKETT